MFESSCPFATMMNNNGEFQKERLRTGLDGVFLGGDANGAELLH